ncbi:hypothetical protein [Halobacteriovorax sp. JY17]|uniref:hypothetical protein n=1 Tax=Halobacteriovorax sp. JY17 TaxID=2014617 RepID=UPI000C4A090E|nr:hypothetical protein [Halobacteriovorax sp. JY17]PIK16646.1 MAG: hypothetical protein CES88_07850 [Halobacteriovorax sp. JY17]
MIFAVVASIATYELSKIEKIGAIRASSILGIFIYFLGLQFSTLDIEVLFGATFVGMCSSNRINRFELVLATSIYLFALSTLSRYFTGFGGLLGMSSFIGVFTIFILTSIHKKYFKERRG